MNILATNPVGAAAACTLKSFNNASAFIGQSKLQQIAIPRPFPSKFQVLTNVDSSYNATELEPLEVDVAVIVIPDMYVNLLAVPANNVVNVVEVSSAFA